MQGGGESRDEMEEEGGRKGEGKGKRKEKKGGSPQVVRKSVQGRPQGGRSETEGERRPPDRTPEERRGATECMGPQGKGRAGDWVL